MSDKNPSTPAIDKLLEDFKKIEEERIKEKEQKKAEKRAGK